MHRTWIILLIPAAILLFRWIRGRRAGTQGTLFLVGNILLGLISLGVIAVIGYGIWTVYQGSVILFGKILYTVLAGAIAAALVWGNVYLWQRWAQAYHMRTLRRKAASRLHVVRGGKAAEPEADDADEEQEDASQPDGED